MSEPKAIVDLYAKVTKEIETNLNGPIRMAKQFLPHLKTKSTAAILNVTSGLAFVPLPISPIYCATKAGLHSFTLSLRVQLKNTNVKVFELAPPATQTELLGIRPGQSNQLKFMSRLAPQFILDQMSKPVDRMLAQTKH